MLALAGLYRRSIALLALLSLVTFSSGASAQLVDTPANLLKTWLEAYATRQGEPMARVYTSDAQLWGSQSKEPSIGIASIKQHYERTGQNVTERSVSLTKVQYQSRKRVTSVTGTLELRAKLKDGTARTNPARFSMTIIRESRRQWAILNHHLSLLPN